VNCAVSGRSLVSDVTEPGQIQSAEEMFSFTQQDWRNGQMHFIDQTRGQVLAKH
jgi:hypothetical protein